MIRAKPLDVVLFQVLWSVKRMADRGSASQLYRPARTLYYIPKSNFNHNLYYIPYIPFHGAIKTRKAISDMGSGNWEEIEDCYITSPLMEQ